MTNPSASDIIFTFADRHVVTIYPDIVDAMRTFMLQPSGNDIRVDVVEAICPLIRDPVS